MTITTIQAQEAITHLEKFIAKKKAKIEDSMKEMQKALKKGDFQQVKANNNFITLYFKGIAETEEEIEFFQHELKKAEAIETEGEGWNVVIDFLEEMYESDMVWYKELKELSYEDRKKETKSVQFIADLNEKEAKKLFRKDVTVRFHKLIGSVKGKAGDHILEISLERNDNGGLDGIVKGDKGTVSLETIIAGGYNIQRAHYRTLVHLKK